MNKAKWIWAVVATVAILSALGTGLWLGGGHTTRQGWEAVSWTASIIAALSLVVTAIVWATSTTRSSSADKPDTPVSTANTANGNVSGGTLAQGHDVHVDNSSHERSRNDFRNSTFNGQFINEQHNHFPRHEVDWPIHVGVIPEEAAHYQHRDVTDQLTEALTGSGTVVLRQVLSGTGGVGKTQLAAHHARIVRKINAPDQRVDVLVWANASSRERITSAYAQAARHLFATVPDDPEDAAPLFLTWLGDPAKNQNRRWLIIWDDLADPASVRDLWPPHDQPNGRVLATTRRRDHCLTTQGRRLLDVDVYTENEAHTFLSAALGEAGVPYTTIELGSLARDLGYLPLALGQAVTYMAELGMGCTAYLDLLNDKMRTLAEVFPDWETPTPLAATWDLSLEQADTFEPQGTARPLMGLIALLDGSGIPECVLTAAPIQDYLATQRTSEQTLPNRRSSSLSMATSEGGLWGRLKLALRGRIRTPSALPAISREDVSRTLASLHRLNLVSRSAFHTTEALEVGLGNSESVIQAHQLVQRATREHHATRPTQENVKAAADALAIMWAEMEQAPRFSEMLRLNTFTLFARHASRIPVEDFLISSSIHPALLWAGNSLSETRQTDRSIAYWKCLIDISTRNIGASHQDTLTAKANLAIALDEKGETETAITELEQVLSKRLDALTPDHQDILTSKFNLASIRGEKGETKRAITDLEEIVPTMEKVLGKENRYTLLAKGNLARFKGHSGDYMAATRALEEVKAEQNNKCARDRSYLFTTLNNIAINKSQQGDPSSALSELEAVLAEQVGLLGPDHPDVFTTRANIASIKYTMGRIEESASNFYEIHDDCLQALTPDHPQTLAMKSNLAAMLGESGKIAEANELYKNLLADHLRIFGSDNPATLTVRNNIYLLQGKNYDPKKSSTELEGLLNDRIRILGDTHPETIETRISLAHMRGMSGNAEMAESDFYFLVNQLSIIHTHDHRLIHLARAGLFQWTEKRASKSYNSQN
ncbi:tetratricopeptide repeat protein [Nocardiopsis sp. MG754419]|uniref:tetratricopeptide repeat protein n=1 Tax=Nocardiopsis sp. MG754419 TaxID=2259865 RepID=UPI001BA6F53F|nr:tetratricopeptide repeat protein [Nocardiopsis sp. MG754419]MBR8745023.1 hypothetical protein [Nocardiopsis sp. MG754419]